MKGLLVTVMLLAVIAVQESRGCTSAIVMPGKSANSHALLWKHRDTGARYNHIMRHEATDSTYEFIALHNGDDVVGQESWMGMNRAGLAVMNTASYNLMPDTATYKDREGFIMTSALQKCGTVDEFANLLDRLPRPLGVQANFGVIDATGAGAYFETDDNGYTRIDIPADTCVARTNYSHTGGKNGRLGVARECTANRFLDRAGCISPRLFLDTLSRGYFDPSTCADLTCGDKVTLLDNGNMIPRYISTSSIVIEAVPSDSDDGLRYKMHVILGYPPVGKEYEVTFDKVPEQVLRGKDGMTQAERESLPMKKKIFTGRKHGSHRVMDLNAIRRYTQKTYQ